MVDRKCSKNHKIKRENVTNLWRFRKVTAARSPLSHISTSGQPDIPVLGTTLQSLVQTFILFPLTELIRVTPKLSAIFTPRLVGADMEMIMGIPLLATLCIISEEILPLVITTRSSVGISSKRHFPKILSMALCLPMSSLKMRMFFGSHKAAL